MNSTLGDGSVRGGDAVALVARIAEMLPALEGERLAELAGALDELTEAVGLRMAVEGRD